MYRGLVLRTASEAKQPIRRSPPAPAEAKASISSAPPTPAPPPKRLVIDSAQGAGWRWEYPLPQGSPLTALWGTGKDNLYATTQSGAILHTADAGNTWSLRYEDTSISLHSIWGSGADDIYAVGDGGTILHSTDGGRTWSLQKSGTQNALYDIWGSSPDNLYVAGDEGTLLHSTDRGQTWSPQPVGVNANLRRIWGNGPDNLYITASLWAYPGEDPSEKLILHRASDGAWRVVYRSKEIIALHDIWGSQEGSVYAVGTNSAPYRYGLVLRSKDSGETWEPLDGPFSQSSGGIHAVWGNQKGEIFVFGEDAAYRSPDQGKTWEDISQISVPLVGTTESTYPLSLTAGESFAVWGDGDDMFLSGERGALLRSEDGGASWVLLSSLSDVCIITMKTGCPNVKDVFVHDNGDIFLAGEQGVSRLRVQGDNAQLTLLNRKPKNAIWGDPSGSYLCAVGDNLSIEISTDGGLNWSTPKPPEQSTQDQESPEPATRPNLTGMYSVVKRPPQPSTNETMLNGVFGLNQDRFVVGQKGFIAYSSDAGESWSIQENPAAKEGNDLQDVWGVDEKTILAVGSQGTILLTRDKGKTWEKKTSNTQQDLISISGNSASLYALGKEGALLHSKDNGETWKNLNITYEEKRRARFAQKEGPEDRGILPVSLWVSPDGEIYVLSIDSVLTSKDQGKTWEKADLPASVLHGSISGDVKGDNLIIAGDGAVLRWK